MMPPKLPNEASYGESLRNLRKRYEMTMGDMARALDVRVPVVSDIELGRGGSCDLAKRFIEALTTRGLDRKAAAVMVAFAELVWPTVSNGIGK